MTQQQIPRPDLPYPGEKPPNRSRLWLWVTLGAAVPIITGLLTWYWPALTTTKPPVPTSRTVLYEAEGSGARGLRSATYTIQTPTGTAQGAINLPMKTRDGDTGLTVPGFNTGDFVYLSVQNADAAGSVTCRITVDGVVISENTSTGGHIIASCKGVVP